MRLTNVLYKVNYHRHFQRIWKRQGRLQAEELKIPAELEELGVVIKDAKEFLPETKKVYQIKKPPGPKPPSVFYQQKKFYIMNGQTKVSEGENQILSLTKTVSYSGLPTELNSLIGVCSLPNQDELVQISILQAHVWDSYQDKLPRKVNPEKPSYVYKRPYGISAERRICSLLHKLTHICDAAIGNYPACLLRDKVIDATSNLAIERSGESVTFQMPSDVLLTATEPLKRFASEAEVDATKHREVPNIYPIKPTLDLNQAEEKPECSYPSRLTNSNIHTLFVVHKKFLPWSPNQLLSRAIATCFAFAAKEAQMKYGFNIKKLPHPIAVQCVYMDLTSFNFIAYQLNTLELDHNEDVKNQVWIDEPASLFDEASEANLVSNYNPNIFPKLLSFYVNGLHPST